MKAIYFTIDLGEVFDDAESSCKQFLGSYLLICSLTHISDYLILCHTCSSVAHLTPSQERVFLWHLQSEKYLKSAIS